VNVVKQVKCADRWRLVPTARKSGRIMRDQVVVHGQVEHHPEGSYFLQWYEAGKCRRQVVRNFDDIATMAQRKALELQARKAGLIPAAAPPDPETRQTPVEEAIDTYLDQVKHQRSKRTYLSYHYTLHTLLPQAYTKTYVEQVEREDILRFITHCFQQGLGNRTVYDKLVVVLQMFKRFGQKGLILSSDWPQYVEAIRPIYEPEEIQAMLGNATEEEAIFLKFLLASGFRDREVRHVIWRDLDFRNSVVRVKAKPVWDFQPKNYEERSVPLPTAMIRQLQALRDRRNAKPADLIFPNSVGKPDSENDMIVKRVAQRAKLNCGQCVTRYGNKCSAGPHCQHFFLHKFRHTFATEHLRHGIDIRTLQVWMGHRDIKSTMVYLKGVQSKDVLVKINAGALAAYVL
jgi:integrase